MWSAEVGGHVHSKHRLVSSRQHRATEVQKLHFFLPVNILMGVAHRLLGPHDTLPCVLILCLLPYFTFVCMLFINVRQAYSEILQ